MLEDKKIGFLGGGFMAEALINGLLNSGMARPENIFATDIRDERLDYLKSEYKINVGRDNLSVAKGSAVLVLAVKPQDIPSLLKEISESVLPECLVISIAAGVKISTIAGSIPGKVCRVMPNTAAQVGEAVTALAFNPLVQKTDVDLAIELFSSVGKTVAVDEEKMDAVTGISGSGPAYIYLVIESMIQAGVESGLTAEESRKLVLQTVKGAAELAIATGEEPAVLRERISSPNGTTVAALKVLEEENVRGSFQSAVAAAVKRSKELG